MASQNGGGGGPWLINDPSMQGLHLNQDIGGGANNFRRNNNINNINNTLLVDEGAGGIDTNNYQSSIHLRKGSM